MKHKWNDYTMRHKRASSVTSTTTGYNALSGPFTVVESFANAYPNANAFFADPFTTGYWRTQDEYRLLAKMLAKVKGGSYNIGVSLAEVDKLATSVVGTVKNLGFGALDLASGRVNSFLRRFGIEGSERVQRRVLRAKDISGRFLEVRYAWEPAIADVYDACQAFEALSNGPRSKVYKCGRKRTIPATVALTYGQIDVVLTVKRTYTYEAYEELAAWRQMGLGNPASILWERIPYSFVLDWFIPIGTYLELIGQVPFLKGRWLRTDFSEYICSGRTRTKPNVINPANTNVITNGGDLDARMVWCTRTPLSSAPSVPKPSISVAGAIHGKRIGNAIALAHQLFDRAANRMLRRSTLGSKALQAIDASFETNQW